MRKYFYFIALLILLVSCKMTSTPSELEVDTAGIALKNNVSDSYFDDIKGKFHREGGTGLGGTFEGSGFEHFDVDSGLWWGEHYDDVYRDKLYSLYLSYHRYFVLRERNGDYYLVEYKEKQNGEDYYTYHYYCYRYYVSDKYMRMELSDEIFDDVFEYVKTKNKRLTEQDYIDYINSRNNI